MAWTFCTKDEVSVLHPISETVLKDEWSDYVEGLIREYLEEPYLGLSQAVENEYHDGDGTVLLRVKKPPIISVESILINDVSLLTSDYVVFESYVQLKAQVFPEGNLNVVISYTSGSTTVSFSVQLTAIAMIVAIANYWGRGGADTSLKWSSGDQKAGEESANKQIGLASHLMGIMKKMLRRPYIRFS
jgi:hypothetical protein